MSPTSQFFYPSVVTHGSPIFLQQKCLYLQPLQWTFFSLFFQLEMKSSEENAFSSASHDLEVRHFSCSLFPLGNFYPLLFLKRLSFLWHSYLKNYELYISSKEQQKLPNQNKSQPVCHYICDTQWKAKESSGTLYTSFFSCGNIFILPFPICSSSPPLLPMIYGKQS